ncbi:MAG: hypothetical protein HC835_02515 [Oscillatoriales cyanobacterium RM2_1_1]|nr:hypothetical protein [Oscillatoriales cyanobacterium SM2_3_0]NJO44587.1 hypothetical protein [Oscillatoriales cyanobacterium RM2_1_1]
MINIANNEGDHYDNSTQDQLENQQHSQPAHRRTAAGLPIRVAHPTPEQILGEDGLLKQLSKGLIERALQGELSHYLEQTSSEVREAEEEANPMA